MFLRLLPAMLALGGLSFADTITLKNGGVIEGTYLGGDARRIKIANGDRVDSYSVDEIQSIQFGGHHDRDRDAQPPASATGVHTGSGGFGAAYRYSAECVSSAAAQWNRNSVGNGAGCADDRSGRFAE